MERKNAEVKDSSILLLPLVVRDDVWFGIFVKILNAIGGYAKHVNEDQEFQ